MNRAQRILKFVAGCPDDSPATLLQIVTAVSDKWDSYERANPGVAAQLLQLVEAGKLKRTGARGSYRYATTAKTFVDQRSGKSAPPKQRAKHQASARAAAQSSRPAAAAKAAAKPARKATADQHFVIVRGGARSLRPTGERETVAEFLARGGRIQKLKPGESSSPLYESVRALNDKTMRKRLAEADNDPDTDLDDVADIAATAHA